MIYKWLPCSTYKLTEGLGKIHHGPPKAKTPSLSLAFMVSFTTTLSTAALVSCRWRWNILNVYPLVNVYITMEKHHFEWEHPLFLWPCSIAMLIYQRVFRWFSHFKLHLWLSIAMLEHQRVDGFRWKEYKKVSCGWYWPLWPPFQIWILIAWVDWDFSGILNHFKPMCNWQRSIVEVNLINTLSKWSDRPKQ